MWGLASIFGKTWAVAQFKRRWKVAKVYGKVVADMEFGQYKVRWDGDDHDLGSTRAHLHYIPPALEADDDAALVACPDAAVAAVPAIPTGQCCRIILLCSDF